LEQVIPRAYLFALPIALALGFGCSGSDTTLERRGGMLPDDGASGAGAGDGQITFCAALTVIRAKCQRCHQEPPQNKAPIAFLTYADTQAQYFDTTLAWWEVMQGVVDRDAMPYVALNEPPTSLKPPVEPLTVDEKATLLGWLNQGALPLGGKDCPE
jgi:hypothetical protein